MRKLLLLLFTVFMVSGCATANADNNQQEQVKKEVLRLLQKEYNEPFKILNFKYKQENYSNPANDCTFIYCKTTKIGVYYLKIQAVDNPIIVMDLEISDKGKESINGLIDSFKKNQLSKAYCVGLGMYYKKNLDNKTEVRQPETKQADEYCDNLGQDFYNFYKKIYDKRHSKT